MFTLSSASQLLATFLYTFRSLQGNVAGSEGGSDPFAQDVQVALLAPCPENVYWSGPIDVFTCVIV